MCISHGEIKEIMDQGVSALISEIAMLKARQDEYQRDLKRHMEDEAKWGAEIRATKDSLEAFKSEMVRQEVVREKTDRRIEDSILEKIKVNDKEERAERDRLMVSMMDTKLSNLKSSLLTWMGFGGVIAIVSVVFYFGGLGEKVTNSEADIKDIKEVLVTGASSVYVDQQNAAQDVRISRIEDTMKEGFADLKQEIRNIQ